MSPRQKHCCKILQVDCLPWAHASPQYSTNGKLKCQLRWAQTKTIIDMLRTAPIYNQKLDDAQFCSCTCAQFIQKGWKTAQALDGTYHVCARQSEIPWPKSLEWVRNTSIHARVLPEPRDMHRLAAEGLLHMAERLADPFRMPHITLCGKSRRSMAGNCLHVGNCMMT